MINFNLGNNTNKDIIIDALDFNLYVVNSSFNDDQLSQIDGMNNQVVEANSMTLDYSDFKLFLRCLFNFDDRIEYNKNLQRDLDIIIYKSLIMYIKTLPKERINKMWYVLMTHKPNGGDLSRLLAF